MIHKYRTSIEVDAPDYEECKRKSWTLREIFKLGMDAKRGNPGMINRIAIAEQELARSHEKVRRLINRIIDLENQQKEQNK